MSYSFYINDVEKPSYNDNFYINYLPAFVFHPYPHESIPEDLRCPTCLKSWDMEFYINTCSHFRGGREDGVPSVPYVELLK